MCQHRFSCRRSRAGVPRSDDHLAAVRTRRHDRRSAGTQVHQDRFHHRRVQGQDRRYRRHPEHSGRRVCVDPESLGEGRGAATDGSDSCRFLLHHRRLLVRLQGGAGLLRPVLWWHEVSARTRRRRRRRAARARLLTFPELCVAAGLSWGRGCTWDGAEPP